MRILYLAHDLDDAAIWRRVSMLETGGAQVDVAGFRRATTPLERPATVLGQTRNGRFLHRALSAARLLLRADVVAPAGPAPDIILARNLEMLPLALRVRKRISRSQPARPRLIYEVLDIHRLMVGPGLVPCLLRWVERVLCRGVDRVLLSSLRFDEEHFQRYGQIRTAPILVENKVWDPTCPPPAPVRPRPPRPVGTPLTIGWFGILRCAESLRCLDTLSRQTDGRIRVVLRGRPARDVLPDFERIVTANPHMSFHGAYSYPADLAQIYGGVDLAWLVDRFDAGANSDWLLPNRLYESCAHGAVPLAVTGTETGRYLARRGLGLVLPDLQPDSAVGLLAGLDAVRLAALRGAIARPDTADWQFTAQDCRRLVAQLAGQSAPEPAAPDLSIPDQIRIAG